MDGAGDRRRAVRAEGKMRADLSAMLLGATQVLRRTAAR